MGIFEIILLYIAVCAFGGMVFEDQHDKRWPLIWGPVVLATVGGFISMIVMTLFAEIVIRVFTLGAYGIHDID